MAVGSSLGKRTAGLSVKFRFWGFWVLEFFWVVGFRARSSGIELLDILGCGFRVEGACLGDTCGGSAMSGVSMPPLRSPTEHGRSVPVRPSVGHTISEEHPTPFHKAPLLLEAPRKPSPLRFDTLQ